MLHFPHYLYFVDEGLLAFVLAVGALLGKGLDGVLLAVFVLVDQVH